MKMVKICSAPTAERLQKLINEYFYSSSYTIVDGKLLRSGLPYLGGEIKVTKNKLTFYQYQP